MTLYPGATGQAVLQLQRSLLALGYPLPRCGADAALGDETLRSLALLLSDHGRAVAEVPGEVTDADLELVAQLLSGAAALPDQLADVRNRAPRVNARGHRPWSQVTGITLHQTACVLGERPARWATIGAHVGITRAGQIVWMHDFTTLVWHGNGFNGSTVGIECDGMYAGVEGDPRTFWRPASDPMRQPQEPTPDLVESARAAIRWIVAEVARHGGQVRLLVAHRQSSDQRRSDPGSALWQRVAMPMHAELGMTDGGPGYRVGTGFAIPAKWDASREEAY